jgi:hypothetical protein
MLDCVPLPPSSLVALVAPNVAAAGVVQRGNAIDGVQWERDRLTLLESGLL